MSGICYFIAIYLCIVVSTAFAGAKIEFDIKEFDCGIAKEGKKDKITAVFTFKNSGDSVLKIENVHSGCGCTVVKYDTLIQPGKTSKIEAIVNIKGNNSGPTTKSLKVNSNAVNEHSVNLTIKATIQNDIDISERHIILRENDTTLSVYLSSQKPDLRVSDISFKVMADLENESGWQVDLPFFLNFKLTPTDSTKIKGYRSYKLEIFRPDINPPVSGVFIIKTNHPDMPEIRISGSIH